MNLRQFLFLLVLSLAVGYTGWLLYASREPEPLPQFVGPPRADYALADFELNSFDALGKLGFRLKAPRLIHDDQRQSYDVDQPTFRFYDSKAGSWRADSDRAVVDIPTRRVALRGGVEVTPEAGADADPWILTTEALDADPATKIVTSALAVTLSRPGSILKGIGLHANLDLNQFALAAQVRGNFEGPHD
ncbi:MAG: LPS export ABC transporter periplasmic protein LptC [Lysobacterales bacterium CG02_land_8_20_14_3_00_62_12]|nr:MAG: LPS export ABC transporter periplasmic protein LptC [Xanthomonadales bacterium CG02_land_8_20_14_3_00_62_12]PJA41244.1 MAG: LPS export ABC transporter periplasmic protein LptC [Xanthomonadales bacterium CG_4_9_14_3_um_filter_62_6]